MRRNASRVGICVISLIGVGLLSLRLDAAPPDLGKQLSPWLEIFHGDRATFRLRGQIDIAVDGKPQRIALNLVRYDDEAFDLQVDHDQYAVEIRRRADVLAFALPRHGKVYCGKGPTEGSDHFTGPNLLNRWITPGTTVKSITQLLATSQADDLASLVELLKVSFDADSQSWVAGERLRIQFANAGREVRVISGDDRVNLVLDEPPAAMPDCLQWPGLEAIEIARGELERTLYRGSRRAFEVLAPSTLLTAPASRQRVVEHGELRSVEGHRVVLLEGTPEQIGQAHGQLLKQESMRCIDSVLYAFGTVQTIATGKWFRTELEQAYSRLEPFIPERHRRETDALAASLDLDPKLVQVVNVFPELFHCSGFALFGKATVDGKLYHGRVLDYMTEIGLQDAATTFIVAPEGFIPFVNVGYAGFIGSVSGMNVEKISLGEMGGRGEGQWDGVPMATLMRRALEECDSLEEVRLLWQNSPRTCEYYYVFADGQDRSAVGVAATPSSIQFVMPGEAHPLLGDGIEDAVVLSAGSRLDELRKRVKSQYGSIDADTAQGLMCRPVAMNSNLHNVLFVPEDGVLYVANADHESPAADRPYVKLDLLDLVGQIGDRRSARLGLNVGSQWPARDTLAASTETDEDARACLEGLCYPSTEFNVTLQESTSTNGDWLVRFPSPKPSGTQRNDLVAMEWYPAKDRFDRVLIAPAAVVVHESGSGMTVGRLIARALRSKGIHAFMIQLPFYGERRGPEGRPRGQALVAALQQGISDVRRARDAVAALPVVDASRISVQGTSLGGFVVATVSGLDRGYHRSFVLLAGGNLYRVLMEGHRDAAKVRNELRESGFTDEQIRDMLYRIEPLRLAHRIDADRTWLFSGTLDEVVPPESAELFASKVGLDASHHIKLLANHYSGIIYMPMITQQMADLIAEASSVDVHQE